jgi:aspartate aminotransferase-like enzyme
VEVAEAARTPMVGHRGPEISALLKETLPAVARLLNTSSSVYPLACSATGAMEGAVRNAAPGPFLHLVGGAFAARWSKLRESCGLAGEDLSVPWGEVLDPEAVREKLRGGEFGAVTLVHNETSTGVLHPLAEIARVVREESDALLLVDTVSSMAACELRLDEWGVDLCLAGTQKAWALPPGLTLVSVSPRALERSAHARGKGTYFDWLLHEEKIRAWQTPSTPPISLLFQLRAALAVMEAEGLPRRYARHLAMRDRVLQWASGRFEPFAAAGHRSPSLTALRAGEVDIAGLLARCRERGFVIGSGYGKTKGEVFRVGHMGEITPELLDECLAVLDEELAAMGATR